MEIKGIKQTTPLFSITGELRYYWKSNGHLQNGVGTKKIEVKKFTAKMAKIESAVKDAYTEINKLPSISAI